MRLDHLCSAHVAGLTGSSEGLPLATSSPAPAPVQGRSDALIASVLRNGQLDTLMIQGGSSFDRAESITTFNRDTLIAGTTSSPDFPVTALKLPSAPGVDRGLFVTRFKEPVRPSVALRSVVELPPGPEVVLEPAFGSTTLRIPVVRRGLFPPASVDIEIRAGTATPGLDFTLQTPQVLFGTGQGTIDIEIRADAVMEFDETFVVSLADPECTGFLGARSEILVVIQDAGVAE